MSNEGEYQADITFLKYSNSRDYVKANHGYTCILIVLETLTRYGYFKPLRTKQAPEVLQAFIEIHQHITRTLNRPFTRLLTDDGGEFNNAQFKQYLADNNITYNVKDPSDRYSLGMIDNLCHTLKRWIDDYRIDTGSISWVDSLPQITEKYNNHKVEIIVRPNRSKKGAIHYSPTHIRENKDIQSKVHFADVMRGSLARTKYDEISINDKVRVRIIPSEDPRDMSAITKRLPSFSKGSEHWSYDVYTVIDKKGYSYILNEKVGKRNSFRRHELLKVPPGSVSIPDPLLKIAHQDRKARRNKRS